MKLDKKLLLQVVRELVELGYDAKLYEGQPGVGDFVVVCQANIRKVTLPCGCIAESGYGYCNQDGKVKVVYTDPTGIPYALWQKEAISFSDNFHHKNVNGKVVCGVDAGNRSRASVSWSDKPMTSMIVGYVNIVKEIPYSYYGDVRHTSKEITE